MSQWIRSLLAVALLVLWSVPAACEYYQYRDENGVLRFTDDIASVPPDQRPTVTTHQSVPSGPAGQKGGSSIGTEAAAAGAATQPNLPGSRTWEGRKTQQLAEFDRKQAELDRMFSDLQNQRVKLESQAPSPKASFEEKAVYNQKVAALNARIDRYEEELAAFTQQVKDYNAKFKKK